LLCGFCLFDAVVVVVVVVVLLLLLLLVVSFSLFLVVSFVPNS